MRLLIITLLMAAASFSQTPPIEPGVSQELARWRAARYSDVRYKLNLTLEKMSPVLKGTMEIRVVVRDAGTGGRGDTGSVGRGEAQSVPPALAGGGAPIILDWRKIKGHEGKSTISNVSINGRISNALEESNEHLIFRDGVVPGENVIKLDFTSPILPSGSAITRYIDKEDGSEYIYSLFVPSDASTAFPVFDQPDLKARFTLHVQAPPDWHCISNGEIITSRGLHDPTTDLRMERAWARETYFSETKPISTYVFAFAAGPWEKISAPSQRQSVPPAVAGGSTAATKNPPATAGGTDSRRRLFASAPSGDLSTSIYVRKSQLAKFQPHAAEVFRLNREGIQFLEEHFNYKFPFPKYDLVLIPEFPFGGMEHAGATFLRESAVIFPSEPTKNDHISRANLIFHEAAHQWFGDTVTMRWFDDLWLKEGFAEFMAYKTLERVMPEYNAWKAFYERNKQSAYLTDSTKGTTPIYQEIKNLNSAKSAYGNIVYRKAPSFLRQAEFYIGAEKFQTAVRAFLKKNEFKNAGWEDLVKEYESASGMDLDQWAEFWVKRPGLAKIRISQTDPKTPPSQIPGYITLAPHWPTHISAEGLPSNAKLPLMKGMMLALGSYRASRTEMGWELPETIEGFERIMYEQYFIFPNYGDLAYGIFLLDDKSRNYVLKNIHNENDEFLRSMMWGALWDSVREGELDPKEYVELVIKNLAVEKDETTTQAILGRAATAMTYYIADKDRDTIAPRLEAILIEKMRSAPTLGQRITYYRALLNVASTENGRGVLKAMLTAETPRREATTGGNPTGREGVKNAERGTRNAESNPKSKIQNPKSETIPLRTKDRFDIVTRLASLNDPDAEKLLAHLEKTETSDDAKRYAYAARAAFPTKETKEKYWNDFTTNKEISESWIEAAFGPFNSVRQADLTLPYLERALNELPNHKRNRKIFFVNGWLAAFIGGQKSEQALAIVNRFLADNPNLDRDLRLKILENVDIIERAVKIRTRYP